MKILFYFSLIFALVNLPSCGKKDPTVPKPRAFPRADRIGVSLVKHSFAHFSFNYPSDAICQEVKREESNNQQWFNMEYNELQATLYCSYTLLGKGALSDMMADNKELLQRQSSMSTRINEYEYINAAESIYGSLYHLDGNVILPIQFYLTDSISYFLRGALYYNVPVKIDSIAPITKSLQADVEKLMESFRHSSVK